MFENLVRDGCFGSDEGSEGGFVFGDGLVHCIQKAGDAFLVGYILGDRDGDFGELVEVEPEAIVGEALGIAPEEADGFREFEKMGGETGVNVGFGRDHDIGGADEGILRDEAADALPHAHHVVCDVTSFCEEVFSGGQCGINPPVHIFTIHDASVHRDGNCRKTRTTTLSALGKELAELGRVDRHPFLSHCVDKEVLGKGGFQSGGLIGELAGIFDGIVKAVEQSSPLAK